MLYTFAKEVEKRSGALRGSLPLHNVTEPRRDVASPYHEKDGSSEAKIQIKTTRT
ncbi:hypothetical protein LTS15_007796 [Exophiala xenobiotica]|nr:hypothetical protein LTS15_007796 [Exophiala xenobiotica]